MRTIRLSPTRRMLLGGVTASALASGASPQSLGNLFGQKAASQAAVPAGLVAAGRQGEIIPRGYSERFKPVHDLIAAARYDGALAYYLAAPTPATATTTAAAQPPGREAQNPAAAPPPAGEQTPRAPIANDPFLLHVEAGLILFEAGRFDESRVQFDLAEAAVGSTATGRSGPKPGILHGLGGTLGMVSGKAMGNEEAGPYHKFDHERVLQLNYLALSYLLHGDRKCYNVTRRCIDEQIALKEKFDKELADVKSKYKTQQQTVNNSKPNDAQALSGLEKEFQSDDTIASRVPNAYVNPLGDYLDGLIQELASEAQPALRDNARIAYQSAAALSGGAPQMISAATALERGRVAIDERIVHVIVAEGFVPERFVLTYGIPFNGRITPLRIPIFKPVPSPIGRMEAVPVLPPAAPKKPAPSARRSRSSRIAAAPAAPTSLQPITLDVIGDVEAIVLRDQKDRTPAIMMSVLTSFLASYGEKELLKSAGLFGTMLTSFRDLKASPDTRSWSSLPRRFHVARVALPAGATAIRLLSADAAGRPLGQQIITIDPANSHSVVYARVVDGSIRGLASRRLWIDGRLDVT